jgi:hypothetical protein
MNSGTIPLAPSIWVSPVLAGPVSGTESYAVTVRHGVGGKVRRVTVQLVCISANGGYNPGDTLEIGGISCYGAAAAAGAVQVWSNEQEAGLAVNTGGGSTFELATKSAGSLVQAYNNCFGLRFIVEVLIP